MSYTRLPDPHPGRCLNTRHDVGPYGQSRRCLEKEGTVHVCRFPDVQRPDPKIQSMTYTRSQPEPEPWVVPPPDKKETQ